LIKALSLVLDVLPDCSFVSTYVPPTLLAHADEVIEYKKGYF
jgi:hypothetical protein